MKRSLALIVTIAQNNVTPIDETEVDEIHAAAAQEQASADKDISENEPSDNEDYNQDDDTPLPRLRRARTPSYNHLKGRNGDGTLPTIARPNEFKHHTHVILQSIILTQYNLKQGIKKFGDDGKAAVLVELQQLYNRDVMSPIGKFNLTAEGRKGALRYLMFLKEKRCGTINGRGCADGRSQREYMTKEET
jgi:hypothetical protein